MPLRITPLIKKIQVRSFGIFQLYLRERYATYDLEIPRHCDSNSGLIVGKSLMFKVWSVSNSKMIEFILYIYLYGGSKQICKKQLFYWYIPFFINNLPLAESLNFLQRKPKRRILGGKDIFRKDVIQLTKMVTNDQDFFAGSI